MDAVKVEYRIKAEFVEKNKQNIAAVMNELKSLGDVGVMYSVFVKEDGCSFVHMAIRKDEEAAGVVPSLQAFQKFQSDLKENLEVKPEATSLDVIDSSFNI